jgi:PAS domain S-box-containing protein
MENTPNMLRNFSSLFKTLINNSYQKNELEGFALVSIKGKIISTNEILRAVTGYSEEDLEKLSAPDFFSGNVEELIAIVNAAKAGRMNWENQSVKTKSGGFIPADISAVYLNQGSGLFSLFFRFKESWVQDTNPNAEGSQQELLNYLLKHVSSVMFVINDKLQTEYVSPSITDFTGYNQAEFEIPGFWQSIILPEDFLKISELRKRNKEDNRYNLTFRLKHKNGQLVELNNSGKIIFSEDGRIYRVLGTITKSTNSGERSEYSGNHLSNIEILMDQLGLVFFAINKDNELIAKNKAFDQAITSLGIEPVELGNLIFPDQINQPTIINKFRELIARVYLVDAISEVVYFNDKHINITIIALRDETQISGFAVLLQDLTKEHQLQKNLDISVANLSAIINSTDELIWSLDKEFRFVAFNSALSNFYKNHFNLEPKIGHSGYSFLNTQEESMIQLRQLYALAFEGKKTTAEIAFGSIIGEVTVSPTINDKGEQIGISAIARDITTRKAFEKNLSDSKKRYKEVVNAVHDIIFQTDLEGNWTFLNKSWERIMEYSIEESIGKPFFNFLHKDDIQRNFELFQPLIAGEKSYCSHDIRYISQSGKVKYIRVYAVLLFNEKDEIAGTSGSLHDLTDETESKEMYKLLSDNIRDLITMHDIDGNIIYASPSIETISGYKVNDLIGKNIRDLVHPEDQQTVLDLFLKLSNSSDEWEQRITYRFRSKDEAYHWFETNGKTLKDRDGKTTGMVASTRVIDERIALETDLTNALNKEKHLHELKSRFVTMTSHEFRTPLATIKTSADILGLKSAAIKDEEMRKSLKKHLSQINREIDRLTQLMSDVLMLGKTESDQIQIHPEITNLVELVYQIAQNHSDRQKDGRTIEVLVEGVPSSKFLDPNLFTHVLNNLIANAFKYSTGCKSPLLKLEFRDTDFTILVKDFGIGIPLEERENIFQSFYRASNADEIEGTGLGLVITKNLVERHKGKISIQHPKEGGTEFILEFGEAVNESSKKTASLPITE